MSKILLAFISLAVLSCSSAKKHDAENSNSDEVSLKADRSEFDELRKDMPVEVRKENDELAGILQLLRNPNGEYERPEKIRERFSKIMRDKRERNNKQFRQEREDFTRLEKDKRAEFSETQKSEKEDFLSDKPSSEKRKRYFDKQDDKRSRFYDDSREKRRSFEAEISTRRKNFEDYNREKTNLFNAEFRNYQKEFDERRKGEDLKKRMEQKGASASAPNSQPASQPNLSGSTEQDEFNQMPTSNSKKIESGE